MSDKTDFPKSAFPCMEFKADDKGIVFGISHTGMSLRDYMAGQALSGMDMGNDGQYSADDHLRRGKARYEAEWRASYAYRVADAMMKERER